MTNNEEDMFDLENMPIVIEEVDESNLDPQELSEFAQLVPIPLATDESASCSFAYKEQEDDIPQEEGILIKKFINGEMTYKEYQEHVEQNDQEEEDESESKHFEKDFAISRKGALKGNLQGPQKRVDGRLKKQRRFLPPALQGLMGQANLCYARGDAEMAKSLCLEIIRQVPLAYEPFVTLAQIYDTEDPDKYMQFSLIAAHLNPSDVDQWVRLAEQSLEIGNTEQALRCYSKAIKADPKNFDLRMKRVQLLENNGDEKLVTKSYFQLLPYIPKERSDFLISTAKSLAQKFHQDNNIISALQAMDKAYEQVPELFKTEDINLLLELLISNGSYRKALDVLVSHTSVSVHEYITDQDEPQKIYEIIVPEDVILDFRTKCAVTLVHLKCYHLLDYVIENIFQFIDVEEAGDCYLDVAEALMKEEQFHHALKLLIPLVQSENFSLAAVWLRHADCLRAIGHFSEAIESYRKVVSMAKHLNARLTLAALLKQQGNYEEALKALEQNPVTEILDSELLYERCLMLKEVGKFEEYLKDGYLLLSRNFIHLRNRQELGIAVTMQKVSSFLGTLKEIRAKTSEDDNEQPEFLKNTPEPTVEKEFNLFWDLVEVAYKIKDYVYLQRLSFNIHTHTAKKFQAHKKELEFLSLLSTFYNKDPQFGYNFIKEWVMRDDNVKNPRLWNLFNLVILVSEDIRYSRYLMRLFERTPVNINATMLQANYHLNSGTYKYALNDYLKLYQVTGEAIHALMVGITLAQIAAQKFTAKKPAMVTQALSFMEEYRKKRPEELLNEVHYNIGRMYHQLGMMSLAICHYKKALETTNDFIDAYPEHLDLRREIAFNMAVAYRASGNMELARKYLYEYIEV